MTAVGVTVVQGWVDNPSSNYGLIVKKDPESGNVPRCYPYMKEGTGGTGIQLIVTYTSSQGIAPTSLGKVKALFK